MSIDHGLYFFRRDLEPADVDDPATATDKVVPIAPLLDDIAGVHESFAIED